MVSRQKEMLAIKCGDCNRHFREVPRPADARDVLDAFYSAIPKKFGTCMGDGKHGTIASGTVLSEDDVMWLTGIAAALVVIEGGKD